MLRFFVVSITLVTFYAALNFCFALFAGLSTMCLLCFAICGLCGSYLPLAVFTFVITYTFDFIASGLAPLLYD